MRDNFKNRHRTSARGRFVPAGAGAFYLPRHLVKKRDEIALTLSFIANRQLFGWAYSGIQPNYFFDMPPDSGVYLTPITLSKDLSPEAKYPGDIDLLVIPYEKDELILDRVVAIEIKAVRANYLKQGKSPNDYGISQAEGLTAMGFPYAAVAHLIVSDQSPRTAWRKTAVARVIEQNDKVEMLPEQEMDMMPVDLMMRAFGRIEKQASESRLGIVAAYVGSSESDLVGASAGGTIWMPHCRSAQRNQAVCPRLLDNIAAYFDQFPNRFINTPRHDPK